MINKYPYRIYADGVFTAWAIVLFLAWRLFNPSRFHNVLIFGIGFLLGVLAASLARKVYR